jgi:hypothetical protein
VLIRPGDCHLDRDDSGGAVIETAMYAGEHWVYAVKLASGERLRCDIDANAHDVLPNGTRVRVRPRVGRTVAFE